MDVRLDLRITNLLISYKKNFNTLLEQDKGKSPKASDIDSRSILESFDGMFDGRSAWKDIYMCMYIVIYMYMYTVQCTVIYMYTVQCTCKGLS